MKRIFLAMLVSGSVFAGQSFKDEAIITSVFPAYRTISVPTQICSYERIPVEVRIPSGTRYESNGSSGKNVLGALIGAGIGYQFGKGNGKDWMTGLGAIAGYDAANSSNRRAVDYRTVTEYRNVERCREVMATKEVEDGYVVSYTYKGMTGTTRTDYAPVGDTITITVSIN